MLEFEESKSEFGYRLDLTPTATGTASLTLMLSNSGTVDIHAGQGLRIEDELIGVDKLMEVCEAMRAGRLTERIWTMRGRVVRVDSELELSSEVLSHQLLNHVPGTLRFAKEEVVQYEPWT